MVNLKNGKLPYNKFRNLQRDKTVNPNRNQNRLMGLESQNEINLQK